MLEKVPFKSYTLDNEREKPKPDLFTVRLNPRERAWLEEIKEDLNIKSDSKALKFSAWIGKNVLHSLLSRKLLKYLFKNDRQKLESFKEF